VNERREPPAPASIDVTGLRKRFAGTEVLHDVDLHVEPGELVCVTGPSGAGKSTLLHLLAALDRPDAGRLVVAGVDLAIRRRATRYRRSTVGIVFQLHNLIPNLTAQENVEIAMLGTARRRRVRRARARELLQAVGLSAAAGQRPPTLSGGERQRVAIARALANDPRVLLADEPTGSLDDESAGLVVDLLDDAAHRRGITVLAVTHDARLTPVADRVLRLADGRITEPGAPTGDRPLQAATR
jgi:putative ABC transport system ATP-binding protein